MMYEDLVKRLREGANEQCFIGCFGKCRSCGIEVVLCQAADAIEELSKKRKAGEWCADYDGYSDGEPVYDMWWCSECGTYFDEWDDRPTWKYCPNCGTKMSGGDEDEEPPKEE